MSNMKEKYKNLLADLDDLQYRMDCGNGLVGAVHEAMRSGNSTAEAYLDALYGAHLYLGTLIDEMSGLVDVLLEEEKRA